MVSVPQDSTIRFFTKFLFYRQNVPPCAGRRGSTRPRTRPGLHRVPTAAGPDSHSDLDGPGAGPDWVLSWAGPGARTQCLLECSYAGPRGPSSMHGVGILCGVRAGRARSAAPDDCGNWRVCPLCAPGCVRFVPRYMVRHDANYPGWCGARL